MKGWGEIDRVARCLLLSVMHGEMSAQQVGKATHKHPSAAHQMLKALALEGLVEVRKVKHPHEGGAHWLWHRTTVPIPLNFAIPDINAPHTPVESSTLTARALTHAMGGDHFPDKTEPNKVHRIR